MSALTDWSDGEITELMAERDAAIARAEKAEAQLLSAAQALYGKIDGTRLVPDMSLELADVTSLRDQASVVQHLRLIAEAQRDAAIRERDAAIARAVDLLREHAYDVRVIDFLAEVDAKGGV